MKIVISSGHGLLVRGAARLIDEVDEARRVVPEVVRCLREAGHQVVEFHDDVSTTQEANLRAIVDYHNAQVRDLDVSVHFNCYVPTNGGRGVEVLYVTEEAVAKRVSAAIASAGGLINRGAHYRSDLYFLNGTTEPAILIEVCFVDAVADVEGYQLYFAEICRAIAAVVKPPAYVDERRLFAHGRCSWFGGPEDMGVGPDEDLAFIYDVREKPVIFLPEQPPNTTGLARRLNPAAMYLAMRWDYDVYSKEYLAGDVMAEVTNPMTGRSVKAHPADWGPHTSTGRVADLSPGVMEALKLKTDDVVEVRFPREVSV